MQVLNDTLDEMDLIDIFRTFHPNAEEYTFFSSAYITFSRIDHMLGHKSNLNKFKKSEISSIFPDHNAEIRHQLQGKNLLNTHTHTRRLNNTFVNNPQVTGEIKKKILETNDNENTTQNLQDAAKAVLRGKFIAIKSYLRKQEKHPIENPTLYLKQLKKEQKATKLREIIRIPTEIDEKEMKETRVKIKKLKAGSLRR